MMWIFCCSGHAFAQEPLPNALSKQTRDRANEVVLQVFNDLLSVKDSFPDLKGFSEKVLIQDDDDRLSFQFNYGDLFSVKRKFSFGYLEADQLFSADRSKGSLSRWPYPVLKIKFVLAEEQVDARLSAYIMSRVEERLQMLEDIQQSNLPLKLDVLAPEWVDLRDDRVRFEVRLINVSDKSWLVRDLGADSLICGINGHPWETGDIQPSTTRKLKPRDSIRKVFAFPVAREMDNIVIFCKYNLSYQGAFPMDTLVLKVKSPEARRAETNDH